MKVVIEMNQEELKEFMHDYCSGVKDLKDGLGFLVFHEAEYKHPKDCKIDHSTLTNTLCPTKNNLEKNEYPTAFRILQINP